MTDQVNTTRFHFWLWLIRLIGVIVPRRLRDDWRQEWESELRNREELLAKWDRLDRRHKLDLLRRSLGALRDALLLQPRRMEDEMFQDLRFGARMLFRQRAITLAAIIALALGIGANSAVFSVVNAVLLRPLPLQNSERMVVIWGNFLTFSMERLRAKAAEYVDYRDQTRSFETVAAFSTDEFNFAGGPQPSRIRGARITANLFPMLSARAAQGRSILPEENQTGRDDVVVVSHRFWRDLLGEGAGVIGRSVRLDDRNYTVIGVMPADFEFPHPSFNFAEPVEFWIPLAFTAEQLVQRQRPYYLNVIGLLKPGVTIEQARAELASLGRRFEREHQEYRGPQNSDMGWRITVIPLQEQIVGNRGHALLVLFAAVGLVLLIACANAANLLLMRATARQKEMAIRAALGAQQLRLIRQLLTESSLIAALGAGGGLFLAWLGVKTLVALGPGDLPRLHEIDVDARILFFTLAVSVLTGLIFGLAPALQSSRPDLQHMLKESGAASLSGGRGRHWLRNLLVVGEVAIAMMLLVGAGLMLNSFLRLQRVNPVVNPGRLLSVRIDLPETRYPTGTQVAAFFRVLIPRVESLPGVDSASLSTVQPLSEAARNDPFSIEGRPLDFNKAPVAGWQHVTPNFFRTLGIPLVAGRDFGERDTYETSGAAIINEALARRYFPEEDPIGKRIALGLPGPPWLTIVGIVKDFPHRGLESRAEPDWYMSYLSQPWRTGYLLARSAGNPEPLAAAIRKEILAVDKDQPVTAIRTISEVIAVTTAPRRFNTLLLTIFASVALALAATGIYSVISYSVTQRRQEIGLRMALGARSGDVIRMVVKQGMKLTLIGIIAGVLGAIAAARVISGLLYGVTATDPATFAAISLLLAIVALLACYLPARRAVRVDPMTALRHQ